MSAWTTAQIEVIREVGYKGVQAVHDTILERFGVEHSLHAIEMQASRVRVSLRVLEECPRCHAVGVRINRQSGMCRRCTIEEHVEEERAFNYVLEAEAAGRNDGPEIMKLEREWAQLRQKNSRLRRKHGLPGKRERGL